MGQADQVSIDTLSEHLMHMLSINALLIYEGRKLKKKKMGTRCGSVIFKSGKFFQVEIKLTKLRISFHFRCQNV